MKSQFLMLQLLFVFAWSYHSTDACADDNQAPTTRPLNFVLVLVDDLGWMDLGCQGSEVYETPHIDKLAASGVRFTNGYASCAVCSPSRASVQTGRYPARLLVTDWIRSRFQGGNIPADKTNPCLKPESEWVGKKVLCPLNALWMESEEVTIAEMLKQAGYATGYVGKWHLGTDPWYPEQQGFDFNAGGCDYGQPPSYFDPYSKPKHKHPMIQAGIPGLPAKKPGEFLSDREADEAVGFIRQNQDKPFFLQLSNYAVHTPIQSKPEVTQKYKAKIEALSRNQELAQKNPVYAGLVESVDDAVGKIEATLKELDLLPNTVFIFTSDNGGLANLTSNGPLRSGKGFPYEGGIRVPMIIRWPQLGAAGSVVTAPVCGIDLFPTIVLGAGLELPTDREIDGVDIRGLLNGDPLQRETLFWHFPHYRHGNGPYSIIRQGDWKLIKYYEDDAAELFHLGDDVSEAKDLAKTMPEKVTELNQKLASHLAAVGAKIPIKNPNFANRKK